MGFVGLGSANSDAVAEIESASLLPSFKISAILWVELSWGPNTKVVGFFFIFLTPLESAQSEFSSSSYHIFSKTSAGSKLLLLLQYFWLFSSIFKNPAVWIWSRLEHKICRTLFQILQNILNHQKLNFTAKDMNFLLQAASVKICYCSYSISASVSSISSALWKELDWGQNLRFVALSL